MPPLRKNNELEKTYDIDAGDLGGESIVCLHPETSAPPSARFAPKAAPAQPVSLGRVAAAELEALRNDMEEARTLAAEYQRELAGKTNDYALLKQVFDKTREHIVSLTTTVTKLREERHAMANDAMKVVALERKVAQLTAERDHYKSMVESRDEWVG
jgi:predicted  nucleic acid-binding Zn-ribbon protein